MNTVSNPFSGIDPINNFTRFKRIIDKISSRETLIQIGIMLAARLHEL